MLTSGGSGIKERSSDHGFAKAVIVKSWYVMTLVLALTVFFCSSAYGCNESLRSELGSVSLPDCRAYEMVTPPYKEGYPLSVVGYASNGERVFMAGLGTLSGIEGAGPSALYGSVYASTRTAGGWQISPLNPPATQYVGALEFLEADNGMSLWDLHTAEQSAAVEDLYVRSATAAFSRIGPLVPPGVGQEEPSNTILESEIHPIATTSDYSHVVLQTISPSGRWPLDHSQGNGDSLYEYSGTANVEPTLVAAIGEKGSTQLTGTIDGQLVGFECGAVLGSGPSGSTYNALSRDGEAIFFTPNLKEKLGCESSAVAPAATEVWARVHGSVHSSVPAETVDLSARPLLSGGGPEECSGACRTSVESGKSFEGASETGEKVFFTSTQQLLNNAHQDPNTGDNAAGKGCSRTEEGSGGCNLYEYDLDAPLGHSLKLIAGGAEVLGVARISEDGSRVYFVAKGVLASGKNRNGVAPVAGKPNLYVYNTNNENLEEPFGFIATLEEADSSDWSRRDFRPVETTPASGRFLLYASSTKNLTSDDSAEASQLFEYDAQTGELVRISKAEHEESGLAENGNAAESSISANGAGLNFAGLDIKSTTNRSNIADDGMTVVFESPGKLSPLALAAEKGCISAYEYRSSGVIGNGAVHLISDGRDVEPFKGGPCTTKFETMDASGSNILFFTADPLLPSDTDGTQADIYDAREEGGFPVSRGQSQCTPEACRGPLAVAVPAFSLADSTVQIAEGNEGPPIVNMTVSTTAAEKLAKALKVCRAKRNKHERKRCEVDARRRHGVNGRSKSKAKKPQPKAGYSSRRAGR